jgi:hypothetical protein
MPKRCKTFTILRGKFPKAESMHETPTAKTEGQEFMNTFQEHDKKPEADCA